MWRRSIAVCLLSCTLLALLPSCGAGTTDSKPRILSYSASPDYASDLRVLKATITQLPGVVDSSIVVNGTTAYITLKLEGGVDAEEGTRVCRLARSNLQEAMPRYNIKVAVHKSDRSVD